MTTAAAIAERERVLTGFLDAERERLAAACHMLARAFAAGGVLVPYGIGTAASDAAHVAVEFLHPVIVGKRALPVLSVADPRLARPGDVALALAHRPGDRGLEDFVAAARERGLLTIAFGAGPQRPAADHGFTVDSGDPHLVQEVHETAYHVLWELVHVFFEHPGLLADACVTCGDVAVEARVVARAGATATVERGGATEDVAVDLVGDVAVGDRLLCHAGVALEKLESASFLYPFLDAREDDPAPVLADVAASTVAKGADTVALRRAIDVLALESCGAAVRAALRAGGRVFTFGNGGSATDAQDLAFDLRAAGVAAVALCDDSATVTAVANDVGFENAFARQLIPLGGPGDVAVAISTSGSSANVVAGLEEARRRGMLTVAIAGYGGGRVADLADHVLAVPGDYVPRLQEAHATIYHLLTGMVTR